MEEHIQNTEHKAVQIPANPVTSVEILREERGHFKKGVSANPAGRPKGTITRKTQILQNFCDDILTGNGQRFKEEMAKLQGKDFINAYLALMEYSMPKMARVEHTGDGESFKVTQIFKIGNVEITL